MGGGKVGKVGDVAPQVRWLVCLVFFFCVKSGVRVGSFFFLGGETALNHPDRSVCWYSY